ncbi:MAG TPA: hypothetical protein VFV50_04560, partial [Bdellovibrionales bacterium]|nr:hypothetical protein [Bdellovibrionales bacterium]
VASPMQSLFLRLPPTLARKLTVSATKMKLFSRAARLALILWLSLVSAGSVSHASTCADLVKDLQSKKEIYRQVFFETEKTPWWIASRSKPGTPYPGDRFVSDAKLLELALQKYDKSDKGMDAFVQLCSDLIRVRGADYHLEFSVNTESGASVRITGWPDRLYELNGRPALFVESRHFGTGLRIGERTAGPVLLSEINLNSVQVKTSTIPDSILHAPKLSVAANLSGLQLVHNLRNGNPEDILFEVFKSKHLGNRGVNEPPVHPRNFVFLQLKPKDIPAASRDIELDLSVLDRKDFFVNPSWHSGAYTESSIRFDERERLVRFLHYVGKRNLSQMNEMVIWAPVPTIKINRVHLPAVSARRLIDRLRGEGVAPPSGKTWEEIFGLPPVDLSPLTR